MLLDLHFVELLLLFLLKQTKFCFLLEAKVDKKKNQRERRKVIMRSIARILKSAIWISPTILLYKL